MNHVCTTVALALAVLAVPASFAESGKSTSMSMQSSVTSSSSGGSQRSEVTMRGNRGVAQIAGDKVELKDGAVFVNGVSFGPVPEGAEVKYSVTPEGRALLVGGEARSASR